MSDLLQVILLIYSAVLVANIIISGVMWRIHRNILFKILIMMWIFSLLNFLMQGVFMTPGWEMYTAFTSYVFVSFSLLQFSHHILEKERRYQVPIYLCAFFYSVGLVLVVNDRYVLGSFFGAVAIIIPMLIAAFNLFQSHLGHGARAFAVLLVCNSLHFLDYPILRFHPQGALAGFSIALFLLFSFSAFFPGFILFQISKIYSDSLTDKVRERTKELEEVTEQNKALVNILCHDIAAPLTVLDFYFDTISHDKPDRESNDFEKRATNSLKTLFEIVSTVKELQTMTYRKIQIELVPLVPLDVLNEVMAFFEQSLMAKNIKIRLENNIAPSSRINADRALLKNQVLSNVISNAIKFSHENSFLDIILSEDRTHLLVTIKDHGIGVPEEMLLKLFKISERTNRPGTRLEKGTGFGLALVKTCLEMMGASIRVESHVKTTDSDSDHGSSFILQFEKAC